MTTRNIPLPWRFKKVGKRYVAGDMGKFLIGLTNSLFQMVTNLDKMMIARLELFRIKSKILPTRVLVYRDGVSEVW